MPITSAEHLSALRTTYKSGFDSDCRNGFIPGCKSSSPKKEFTLSKDGTITRIPGLKDLEGRHSGFPLISRTVLGIATRVLSRLTAE